MKAKTAYQPMDTFIGALAFEKCLELRKQSYKKQYKQF
jgi:hypothetical protein